MLILSINPSHKSAQDNDIQKLQTCTSFLMDILEEIKQLFIHIHTISEKSFS